MKRARREHAAFDVVRCVLERVRDEHPRAARRDDDDAMAMM